MMQIVPVLDIQGGQVVRAVGGRRADYRPLVSKLTSSTDPLEVAYAFRARFGLSEIYVADLDAIAGSAPSISTYDRLREDGFRIWVDAGVRETKDAERIAKHCDSLVVGLETVGGPETFFEIAAFLLPYAGTAGEGMGARVLRGAIPTHPLSPRSGGRGEKTGRIVFSIDLMNGRPLGTWNHDDPNKIVELAVAASIKRILVLDLARVGTGSGIGTDDLLRSLIHRFAGVEFFAGGGVRNREDRYHLESIGVAGVLVASALHDGLI